MVKILLLDLTKINETKQLNFGNFNVHKNVWYAVTEERNTLVILVGGGESPDQLPCHHQQHI